MIELWATFLLLLNVDTIVPYYLSRYDREQLPRFCERLGNPACEWLSRSGQTSILIVLDSQLNSYDRELLPRLRERLDGPACECNGCILKRIHYTGAHERGSQLTARAQCPAGPACKRKALCALRMHLHDELCLLHTALSFWPIRCVRTLTDTFWKIFFIYSNTSMYNVNNMIIDKLCTTCMGCQKSNDQCEKWHMNLSVSTIQLFLVCSLIAIDT